MPACRAVLPCTVPSSALPQPLRAFKTVLTALCLAISVLAASACRTLPSAPASQPAPTPAPVAPSATATAMTDPRAHGRFLERELRLQDGATHRYQVFVPSRRAGGERPPLIVFLHGSGERGDDNHRQVEVGLGPVVRRRADAFPAIVVFPQMHAAPADAEGFHRVVLAMLDRSQAEFGADPQRIYLTGLSLGGFQSYELAMLQPHRFAAIVPVCGGYEAERIARIEGLRERSALSLDQAFAPLARQPIWIFHGARDDIVPPRHSRDIAAALRRAGGPRPVCE